MSTISTLYAAFSIFIGANLIVSIKTDANLANSNGFETYDYIEPLSDKIFSSRLREFLSRDIFTQADPVHYLRQKAMQLPFRKMELINEELYSGLTKNAGHDGRFPPIYYPYAKLAWSLLSCIINLDGVSVIIETAKGHNFYSLPHPDISKLDSELSPLFSLDIFSDPNPPSVLIDKLLEVPEKSFSSIAKKLDYPKDSITLQFYQYYPTYSLRLCRFLQKNSIQLKNLQRYAAEIRKLKLPVPMISQSEQK